MSAPPIPTDPDLTEDAFCGGQLRLRQPRRGFRAGLDSILLASAVTPGVRLMEAGCGVGAALLAVALRLPQSSLLGIEQQPAIADLARSNAAANGLADRVRIETGDALQAGGQAGGQGGFDGVFCNPPYDDGRLGRLPAPERRHAHVTDYGLDMWVARLADRLVGGGALTMIHRADRLDALLSALSGRLGGASVRPLHPHETTPASRVIIRAIKGSRAPLTLLPGLVLHTADGRFTPTADALLRGQANLDW
jgi:tRNA1(Val) A37 N6-methylase TrmN6